MKSPFAPYLPPAVYLSLAAAHFALVWLLPHFPSQDGPSHVYNLSILKDLIAGGKTWAWAYATQLSLTPNLGFQIIAYPLLDWFQPWAVEKLFVSAYLLLLFISGPALLKMLDKPVFPSSFLIFPAALNYSLAMGFYSYIIALPLVLLAGGVCWRLRNSGLLRQCLAVTGCGLTIYCFHLIACAYFVMLVAIQQLLTREGGIGRRIGHGTLVLLPTVIALLIYLKTAARGPRFALIPFAKHFAVVFNDLITFGAVSFSRLQVLNGIALLLAVYLAVRSRDWRNPAATDQAFGVFAAALAAIAAFAPASLGGGSYFNERIPQMVLLGIIPLAAGPLRHTERQTARPYLLPMVAAVCLLLNAIAYRDKSALVDEYLSLLETPLKPRSVIAAVGPYECLRANVLLHADSYYALKHKLVATGNYETVLPYFPVKLLPQLYQKLPLPDKIDCSPEQVDFTYYPEVRYLLAWKRYNNTYVLQLFHPVAATAAITILERTSGSVSPTKPPRHWSRQTGSGVR